MARRNRINQGPLVVVMLVILAAWLFIQGGDEASLFSPAGIFLLFALLLVLNMLLRKKAAPPRKSTPVTAIYVRPPASRPERGKTVIRSRAARTAKPETWPYDGSYCVHCGLKKRDEEAVCRRCRQAVNYPSKPA